MMDRFRVIPRLRRLLRAAPAAFRRDPVFRYAAIGAAVSLLALLVRLGGSDPADGGARPQTPPAPAALGSSYGQAGPSLPSPAPSASPSPAQISPSRSLDGVRVDPGGTPADRFGTVPSIARERP